MGGSLLVRAVIAVVLMVLFFAASVAAVAGLLWLGVHLFMLLETFHGRGVFFIGLAAVACMAAAGVVAWSVLPRFDRFEPPGPEVSRTTQTALFDELRRVARSTGEAMPVHVYLVDEVNAFVTQRGGLMGFGSRRVMGIGLPLLRALTVSELRAVLAHEMGHFYGGDTRLGPWIYKTRGAMGRTVVNLERAGAEAASIHELIPILFIVVRAPFLAFAKGFLRVSQAVSRAQEYSADRVAVRSEGAAALIGGLKKSHAAGLAHELYLRNEVAPLIEHGVLPPIGEGFSRFIGDRRISGLLDDAVEAELREGQGDPYDSHPPLRERIAAAAAVPGAATRATDDRCAIELVVNAEQFESAMIAARVEGRLTAVPWSETGRYWIDGWRSSVKEGQRHLAALTVATVPSTPAEVRALARKVHGPTMADEPAVMARWAAGVLGAAIAVILVDAGYQVVSEPGAPFRFRDGDTVVEPFVELDALFSGKTTHDAWVARYAALGLADRALATS